MNKTKIEYLDYCWNFLTGCNNWRNPAICGGGGTEFKCWAKSMAERFGWWFGPEYWISRIVEPYKIRGSKRIGVCFTGDLFANDVDPLKFGMKDDIMTVIHWTPKHQYFFLTKCPWNLAKWGKFPDNAWVGVSVTNERQYNQAIHHLADVEAKNKWLSFEPLMESVKPTDDMAVVGIKWIVIGGLSNKPINQQPKGEWIRDIHCAAEEQGIPYFDKDNLKGVIK